MAFPVATARERSMGMMAHMAAELAGPVEIVGTKEVRA